MPTSSEKPEQPSWFFAGDVISKLDQKFRLTIPAGWRAAGALKELYLVPNTARGCYTAIPKDVLQRIDREIRGGDSTPETQRRKITALYSSAVPATVDSQGRMTLTEEIRLVMNVHAEVALSGSSDRIEIRAVETYREWKKQTTSDHGEMMRSIGL